MAHRLVKLSLEIRWCGELHRVNYLSNTTYSYIPCKAWSGFLQNFKSKRKSYRGEYGEIIMQNYVTLIDLDESIEESRFIQKSNIVIETFDHTGKIYPLHINGHYLVDLELRQFDFAEPEIISCAQNKVEQIGESFAHYLYGYVENNIFHVGGFLFDFSEYNDYDQYEGKYLKFKADRINVEFLKELPGK